MCSRRWARWRPPSRAKLKVALTQLETERLAPGRTANAEAQEHYLRGRDLVYRRDTASVRQAIAELTESVRLDSSNASAWASLGLAYGLRTNQSMPARDSIYIGYARGLAAAERAMALDSLNPEGFAVRGYLGLYSGGPADSTDAVLRRAIRLRPNYAEAQGWLAQAPATPEYEAAAAMDTAVRLDPVSPGMQLARMVMARMLDSASMGARYGEPMARLRPDLDVAVQLAAYSLAELGRTDACLALSPAPVPRAICLHRAGRHAEAGRLLSTEAARLRAGAHDLWLRWLPLALATTGQLERAIQSERELVRYQPTVPLPRAGNQLLRTSADPTGTRFVEAVRSLNVQAWDERVRSARAAVHR